MYIHILGYKLKNFNKILTKQIQFEGFSLSKQFITTTFLLFFFQRGSPTSNECDFHCCSLHAGQSTHKSVATSPIQVKLRCDDRFTHAFTACSCVFKVIKLVGSNQPDYFENASACSKRTLKTTVATQLKL